MPMSKSFKRRLFRRLPEIIEEFGTPFLIYDAAGILETGRRMIEAFRRTPYRNFYAVKALPNRSILKLLYEQLGFGFDCSSIPELKLSRSVGGVGTDIMLTSNNTSDQEFQVAGAFGGCILNLDDVSLIRSVPKPFPKTICFRINPGATMIRDSVIGNPVDAKYGITLDQVVPAYRKTLELGSDCHGLHAMLASNSLKYQEMVETVEMLLGLCLKLKRKLGIRCKFINFGGGWSIPYRPGQAEIPLEQMAKEIVVLLERFELEHGWRPFLMSECGRYVTGPHGALISKVINEKRIYKRFIGVDSCMSAFMRPGMYYPTGGYHGQIFLSPKGNPLRGRLEKMNVVGSLCENNDQFARDRELPRSVHKGCISVMEDAGAHAMGGFTYNGRTRPQELMILSSGKVVQIRRAETADDLFSTLVTPGLPIE